MHEPRLEYGWSVVLGPGVPANRGRTRSVGRHGVVGVGKVEPGGRDVVELLTRPRNGIRQVDDVEDLGAAEAGDLHSSHEGDARGSPDHAGMRPTSVSRSGDHWSAALRPRVGREPGPLPPRPSRRRPAAGIGRSTECIDQPAEKCWGGGRHRRSGASAVRLSGVATAEPAGGGGPPCRSPGPGAVPARGRRVRPGSQHAEVSRPGDHQPGGPPGLGTAAYYIAGSCGRKPVPASCTTPSSSTGRSRTTRNGTCRSSASWRPPRDDGRAGCVSGCFPS